MYNKESALCNLQWFICHKTKTNQKMKKKSDHDCHDIKINQSIQILHIND